MLRLAEYLPPWKCRSPLPENKIIFFSVAFWELPGDLQ